MPTLDIPRQADQHKDKPTKLNTHRHKKRVRKSIDKKRKNAEEKNKERYGYIEHGTKVIQRYKSDVARAPAYRPERLTKGGYHSTYPVREGMLDSQMNQQNLIDSIIKRKRNELSFQTMYKQMASGELDQLDEQHRKDMIEMNMQLDKETKQEKHLRELKKVKEEWENKKSSNMALGTELYPRRTSKKIKTQEIIEDTEKAKSKLEKEKEKTRAIKDLKDTNDKILSEEGKIAVLKKEFAGRFHEPNKVLLELEDSNSVAEFKQKFEQRAKELQTTKSNYEKATQQLNNMMQVDRELQVAEEELYARGNQDPIHGAKIAQIQTKYGTPEQRLAAMEQYMQDHKKAQDALKKSTQETREYIDNFHAKKTALETETAEIEDRARKILEKSVYVPGRVKEQLPNLHRNDLKMELERINKYEIDENRQQMERLRDLIEQAHKLENEYHEREISVIEPLKEALDYAEVHLDNFPNQ